MLISNGAETFRSRNAHYPRYYCTNIAMQNWDVQKTLKIFAKAKLRFVKMKTCKSEISHFVIQITFQNYNETLQCNFILYKIYGHQIRLQSWKLWRVQHLLKKILSNFTFVLKLIMVEHNTIEDSKVFAKTIWNYSVICKKVLKLISVGKKLLKLIIDNH